MDEKRNINNLRDEFYKDCTLKGVIDNLGFICKYLNIFEIIVTILFMIALCSLLLYFFVGNYRIWYILAIFVEPTSIRSISFWLILLFIYILVVICVTVKGEKIVFSKLNKKGIIKQQINKKAFKFLFQMPDLTLMVDNLTKSKKEDFFKQNLIEYSIDKLKNIYEFNKNNYQIVQDDISRQSKLNYLITFIGFIFPTILSLIINWLTGNIHDLNDVLAGIVIVIAVFFVYYLIIKLIEKADDKIFISKSRFEQYKIIEFSYYLEDIIFNYEYYSTKNIEDEVKQEETKEETTQEN